MYRVIHLPRNSARVPPFEAWKLLQTFSRRRLSPFEFIATLLLLRQCEPPSFFLRYDYCLLDASPDWPWAQRSSWLFHSCLLHFSLKPFFMTFEAVFEGTRSFRGDDTRVPVVH